MRFLYTLLLAVVLPVAASASTISFEFTAVLKSQTVYSGGSTSPIDAPPLTGAFSGLPVGESLNGLAHLTYEPEKSRGPLPFLWRVRGSCSVGGVDCGFGGETVFNDPLGASSFLNTQQGSFVMTDGWDGTRFDISPTGSTMVYGGTASDGVSPYEAFFELTDLSFREPAAAVANVAIVPLPSSALLLLGGLGATAFWRRRKETI